MDERDAAVEVGRLPLIEEVPRITRRRRVTGRVRLAVTTAEEVAEVPATQLSRVVEITHVPQGHEVEAPPPVRQDGDTVVIPVLEERLVVVRRLVLREEIHLRLRSEAQAVTLSATLRRQSAEVARLPPEPGDIPFMSRTLTALFDSRVMACPECLLQYLYCCSTTGGSFTFLAVRPLPVCSLLNTRTKGY